VSDFFALHAALARQHAPAAQLVGFDLVHLRDRPINRADSASEAVFVTCVGD
jgi:hypothetical protein